ncbi:MAG: SUMF1/EgtB/PvdO family nonheme iron enzyme [Chloroflexota bacterium]
MRLFISYARVDKPYCKQIIDLLDMHDVWYDQRLHIGQKWWDQITYRLDWCDGFVYLLSPDSVASEYCRNEVSLAISKDKKILPVLIQSGTKVPPELAQYQWADFSSGLDVGAVKSLLTAIFIAERQLKQEAASAPALSVSSVPALAPVTVYQPASTLPRVDGSALLDEAVIAFRQCDYDKAVRLLKEVQESGYMSRFIDVPSMLRQADAALKRQAYEREAQREYAPIANMMKDATTRALGCTAFRAFQMTFPDYDPENLKVIYDQTILTQPPFDLHRAMPMLEWCHIPPGKSLAGRARKASEPGEFFMSKYPVTNAQFQAFVEAPDGYKNPAWWQSSLEVRRWHADHPKAIDASPGQDNHPRTNVCWYEASAFCQWLSYKTGWTVKLPTEQQWQRAAKGDTNWRYPWGSKFDQNLCNTKESDIKGTTSVTHYPKSASPYGVWDQLGNVWEWCLNGHASEEITDVTVDILRGVRGGSFMSPRKHASINFHYVLNPLYRYKSIGFRLACETGAEFLSI